MSLHSEDVPDSWEAYVREDDDLPIKQKKKTKQKKGKGEPQPDQSNESKLSNLDETKLANNIKTQLFVSKTSPFSPKSPASPQSPEELREKRRERFALHLDGTEESIKAEIRKNAARSLEKDYIRIPDSSTIRDEKVIKEAIKMLRKKWELGGTDYNYFCDQFKSIRQDLVVQRIQNETTLEAYQLHGRIALQSGDVDEFNCCQGMLFDLFALFNSKKLKIKKCRKEFTGYKLLYLYHIQDFQQLSYLIANLSKRDVTYEGIRNALEVISALNSSNFIQFFRLYREQSTNLNNFVINLFIDRVRKRTIQAWVRSIREVIPLSYIANQLNFKNEKDCYFFLQDMGARIDKENNIVTKESIPQVCK